MLYRCVLSLSSLSIDSLQEINIDRPPSSGQRRRRAPTGRQRRRCQRQPSLSLLHTTTAATATPCHHTLLHQPSAISKLPTDSLALLAAMVASPPPAPFWLAQGDDGKWGCCICAAARTAAASRNDASKWRYVAFAHFDVQRLKTGNVRRHERCKAHRDALKAAGLPAAASQAQEGEAGEWGCSHNRPDHEILAKDTTQLLKAYAP